MLRVNEYQFYELAAVIHPLTELSNDARYSQEWYKLIDAKTALQNIFRSRSLEFCLNQAEELFAALRGIVPDDFDEAVKKLPADASKEEVMGYLCYPVREAAKKFEYVLSAELSNSDTYWISPKGTHKTSRLLAGARYELPPDLLRMIPEVAAIELDEAGRCYLFDVSTAAGFHLFRATESVIRQYYEFVVGVKPAAKSRNWGAYIRGLNERGANAKVTAHLDHIRGQYRNPVLHPDAFLSAEDAQILFSVCIGAIVMMEAEMRSPTGAALPLPPSGP
jgi:hypothetical protein